LIRRADAIARGDMPSATMDEVFDDTTKTLLRVTASNTNAL